MSDCNYCPVEKECHYPYKPCDCVHQRKFWNKERRQEYDADENLKLNKALVIKSVCICGSEEPYKPSDSAPGYEYCTKCYISRQMQTVL